MSERGDQPDAARRYEATYSLVRVGDARVPVVVDQSEIAVIEVTGGLLELNADGSFRRERYLRRTARAGDSTTSVDSIEGEYRVSDGDLELIVAETVIERLDVLNADSVLVTTYSDDPGEGVDIFIPYTYASGHN